MSFLPGAPLAVCSAQPFLTPADIEDLDADWKSLLSDVDARLLAQGARVMDSRERSVAIKKLLVATGTRGVDFAMNATIDEVMHFRRFHGN